MESNCDSKSRKKGISVKKYKIVRAVVALLCVIMLAMTIVPTIPTYAAEDPDESYNMEAVSNSLGTIMSIGTTPVDVAKEDEKGASVRGISVLPNGDTKYAGNGGLMLAYTSKPTSIGQWVASKISASSQAYDYQSLIKLKVVKGDETGTNTMVYRYAIYGNTLRQLGLDDTVTSAANKFPAKRFICGTITYVSYIFASGVTGLFGLVIKILQFLNPFSWLDNITKDYSASLGAQYGTTYTGANSGTSAMKTVLLYIAKIYSSLCNLSWYFIIPMCIALYLTNIFLFRKTSGSKRFFKRVIFIAIGVPLIGGTYTSFLKETGDMFKEGTNSYADGVIASVLVDFEGWASNTHLAPPNESANGTYEIAASVPIKKEERTKSSFPIGGIVTNKSYYYIRELTREINTRASGFDFSNNGSELEFDDTDVTTFGTSSSSSSSEVNVSEEDIGLGDSDYEVKNVSDDNSQSEYIRNLILRYKHGDVYTSDQYASAIQSHMTDMSSDDNVAAVIVRMMKGTSRYNNFPTYSGEDYLWGQIASVFSSDKNKVDWNVVIGEKSKTFNEAETSDERLAKKDTNFFTLNGTDYSIFHDGSLIVNETQKDKKSDDSYTVYNYVMSGNGINSQYGKDAKNQMWEERKVGLSTMSMYNYLNSEFTSTGVITYGGGNVLTNGLTRANHYSVNLVGADGFTTFVIWLDAIILLTCMTAIGIMYAIGMFMGTVKYTFKAIGAMPMAMVGSMRYIAKFISTIVAMIANILVTAVMYGVVIEVILGIRDIFHANPVLLAIASSVGIIGVMIFGSSLSIIVLIWSTVIILRVRRNAVNSITEWTAQVVGKFFEADGHADPSKNKGNIGQKIASGLATGAALTAGHDMLKHASAIGGALSGKDNDGSDDGSGGGDDGDRNDSGGVIEKEVSQDHNNSQNGTNKEIDGGEKVSQDHNNSQNGTNKETDGGEKVSQDHNNSQNGTNKEIDGGEKVSQDHNNSQNGTNKETDGGEKVSQEQSNRKVQSDKDESAELSSEKTFDNNNQEMTQTTQVLSGVNEQPTENGNGVNEQPTENGNGDGQRGVNEQPTENGNGDGQRGVNEQPTENGDTKQPTGQNGENGDGNGENGDTKQLKVVQNGENENGGEQTTENGIIKDIPPQNTGVDGQMPSGNKNLYNNGNSQDASNNVPPKNLNGLNDSGTGGGNSNKDNVRSKQHTAQASVGKFAVTSNITNNITKGGTINNIQKGGGGGNGPSFNMTNSASIRGNINNTQNHSGGGGGNVKNNSIGRNTQNVTNVNNITNVRNGGGGGNHSGGVGNVKNNSISRKTQNVTNVNNITNVRNGGSDEKK